MLGDFRDVIEINLRYGFLFSYNMLEVNASLDTEKSWKYEHFLNYNQKLASYMVSEEKSLGFVSTDDGYKAESALLSPFTDNRAAANSKLLVKDEVLHLLRKHKHKDQN